MLPRASLFLASVASLCFALQACSSSDDGGASSPGSGLPVGYGGSGGSGGAGGDAGQGAGGQGASGSSSSSATLGASCSMVGVACDESSPGDLLVCKSGSWQLLTHCKGGCQDGGCLAPQSPTAGEACLTDEGSIVCGAAAGTPDGKAVLQCKKGVYQKVFACPGGTDCVDVQGHAAVRCGTGSSSPSYSLDGAPCPSDGSAACSFDESAVLWCEKGIWTTAVHCPPSACTRKSKPDTGDTYIACANDGYTVGDQCKFTAGNVVCSTDLSKILGCADGKTVVVKDCGSAKCVKVLQDGNSVLNCQ